MSKDASKAPLQVEMWLDQYIKQECACIHACMQAHMHAYTYTHTHTHTYTCIQGFHFGILYATSFLSDLISNCMVHN